MGESGRNSDARNSLACTERRSPSEGEVGRLAERPKPCHPAHGVGTSVDQSDCKNASSSPDDGSSGSDVSEAIQSPTNRKPATSISRLPQSGENCGPTQSVGTR